MAYTAKHTAGQWPDKIVSGEIRYARADNYDGFYLADASHGIPTFGSVTDTAIPTIRGQHVRVFNYPGQTEAIAAELVIRWNAHIDLFSALKDCVLLLENEFPNPAPNGQIARARAAIAKAESRS